MSRNTVNVVQPATREAKAVPRPRRSRLRQPRARRATLVAVAIAVIGGWGASGAHAAAYGEQQSRWPGGVVNYAFDPSVPAGSPIRATVERAVGHYNWYYSITGVKLVANSNPWTHHVRIFTTTGPSRVSRVGYPVGPVLGRSYTSMWLNTEQPSWQVAVHEFGHAIGLSDEHRRCDCDPRVDAPADEPEVTKQCDLPTAEDYNTMSIMHTTRRSSTGSARSSTRGSSCRRSRACTPASPTPTCAPSRRCTAATRPSRSSAS